MDASTARLLEDNDKDEFNEDIHFSDDDIQEVPATFATLAPTNINKADKNKLNIDLNRKKFLQSAPSMMKLMNYASNKKQRPSAGPKTISLNINGASNTASIPHNEDDEDQPSPINRINNEETTELKLDSLDATKRGHGRKGSVVDELLAGKIEDHIDHPADDDIDMQLLAKQAAEEFESLARQNDELFKEKEALRLKNTDLNEENDTLKEELNKLDEYKEMIETLQTENQRYQTELDMVQQEKDLYQEQIQTLQSQLKSVEDSMAESNGIMMESNNDDGGGGVDQGMVPSIVSTNNDNKNAEYLQMEIKKLTQENQELHGQIDEYKIENERIKDLENKYKESQQEIERLNANLEKQQNNYLELQHSKQDKIDKLQSENNKTNEVLLDEYKNKEQSYLDTIKEQEAMIQELKATNDDLDTQRTSLAMTSSDQKMAMMRHRTQANVMGGADENEYDDDPFGGGNIGGTSPLPDEEPSYEEPDMDHPVVVDNESMKPQEKEQEIIEELKNEIAGLRRKMSNMEDNELGNVQKLLDLTMMGESNNNLLKEQLEEEEYEYEEVEEEVEVEVTDDEAEEVDVEQLARELEEKEKQLEGVVEQRDEFERKMKDVTEQVCFCFGLFCDFLF